MVDLCARAARSPDPGAADRPRDGATRVVVPREAAGRAAGTIPLGSICRWWVPSRKAQFANGNFYKAAVMQVRKK